MRPIRLGIAGAGRVARLCVPGYLADERCEVVALAEPRTERAARVAAAWRVPAVYPDLEAMLAGEDLDAVEILTPTHLHHEHGLAALRAGKHVSCPPPLSTTVDEGLQLEAEAQAAGRVLHAGDPFRHHPAFLRGREIVASGAVGEPVRVRIRTLVGSPPAGSDDGPDPDGYLWRLDERVPGGHAFDVMTARLALAEWLVGVPVRAVRMQMRREAAYYEPFVAVLEYERQGLLGIVDSQYAPEMAVHGHRACDDLVEVQGTEGLVVVTEPGGGPLGLPVLLVQDRNGRRTEDPGDGLVVGFRRSAQHFLDVLVGGADAGAGVAAARRGVQLCLAAYRSALIGRAVEPASVARRVVAPGWYA